MTLYGKIIAEKFVGKKMIGTFSGLKKYGPISLN